MSRRIVDGERWIAERTRFLGEQLAGGELSEDQRNLAEAELEKLSQARGLPTAAYRWPRFLRWVGRNR
jgi:hypothetical protein